MGVKRMNKDARNIGEQIKELIDQLVLMVETKSMVGKPTVKLKGGANTFKGASGAINMLKDEGFFNTPRDLSIVMEKLKEIGRYYPKTTVAMNMLNFTKRRIFNRLKDKETRNWQYVLRK
jgi:UTP:GlnB (protein PII) uridylyltransferase